MDPPTAESSNHQSAHPHAPSGRLRTLLRVGLGLVLLAGAGWLVWANHAFRAIEVVISGVVMGFGTGGVAAVSKPTDTVFIHSASSVVGLKITASCTAVFLLVPFLALGAIMMGSPRLHVHRVLIGLASGIMLVFWLNQLRFLVIAWATHNWGIGGGFEWSHVLAGSVITTLAMLIALFVFARISLAGRRSAA